MNLSLFETKHRVATQLLEKTSLFPAHHRLSVFRDDVFEYLIENQFDMSVKEYYNSDIYNLFMNKDIYQKISFKKL